MNPYSVVAESHAIRAYESIRHQTTDCEKISKNTGLSEERVFLVKAYIFFSQHRLVDGIKRFDPSYEMAESWRRLSGKNKQHIQPHDLLLLKHELYEIGLILKEGVSQLDAHIKASVRYNYAKESASFYARNGFKPAYV